MSSIVVYKWLLWSQQASDNGTFDPSTMMRIRWGDGGDDVTHNVLWGTSSTSLINIATSTSVISNPGGLTGWTALANPVNLFHTVLLTDLTPNTDYYFLIEGDTDTTPRKFRTAPEHGSSINLNFAHTSDSQAASTTDRRKSWSSVASLEPDFHLCTGDTVDQGHTPSQWNSLLTDLCNGVGATSGRLETPSGYFVPLITTYGNHETYGSDVDSYPLVMTDLVYYSVQIGNVFVIVLPQDENPPQGISADTPALLTWLEEELISASTNPTVDWIFAAYHKASFPTWYTWASSAASLQRTYWWPLFEQYGVSACFGGHEHTPKISKPIVNASTAVEATYIDTSDFVGIREHTALPGGGSLRNGGNSLAWRDLTKLNYLATYGGTAAWNHRGLAFHQIDNVDRTLRSRHFWNDGNPPVTTIGDVTVPQKKIPFSAIQIISPMGGEVYNTGTVEISWQPTFEDDNITCEIEYTDFYNGDSTVWNALRKRISSYSDSYTWTVGKMLKSEHCRVRVRTKNINTDETSEWSLCGEDFSVNVYQLLAPVIINPVSELVYSDFILIILDESLTINTYNQKVLYTLEYSSESKDIDWTVIVQGATVGQTSFRWVTESLSPADDYVLRLTAEGGDQVARSYVYNINIHPSGLFIIDTVPPEAILQAETSITSQEQQIINIFASDSTTTVEDMQLRECNNFGLTRLGPIEESATEPSCPLIDELLKTDPTLKTLGKIQNYEPKILWTLSNVSGTKKIEALFRDAAGNMSLSLPSKIFLSLLQSGYAINDFLIRLETKTSLNLTETKDVTTFKETSYTTEVMYVAMESGDFWAINQYPELLYSLNKPIKRLGSLFNLIYLFTYSTSSEMYRHDGTDATLIFQFPSSETKAVASFRSGMYVGLNNGELWKFDGTSFSLLRTFTDTITSLTADTVYLYIGFDNGDIITTYDGATFYNNTW